MSANSTQNLSESAAVQHAFRAALDEAKRFEGATSPNPPVGAAALDTSGALLGVAAHERAGTAHAEAKLIEQLRAQGALDQVATLIVTLEPCNHQGRTPPCSRAIAAAGIRCVIYGSSDPNPKAAGGAAWLAGHGIEVRLLTDPALARECARLIGPFAKWARTGRPWITIKRALQADGSMIPPPGQKTFTSPESLRFAHELRRRADAILTGSGTVLADQPEFTVRLVPDHPDKRRIVIVLDRRGRVPETWFEEARKRGLDAHRMGTVDEAIEFLCKNNTLEVLVEAGPHLSEDLLRRGFWDENVVITAKSQTDKDRIEIALRES
jgi:diaminohydroxyphosphoribosylaminopyrimidine deaminase/5-amino-6-(5-phosphoribosylamino)uracil reductase